MYTPPAPTFDTNDSLAESALLLGQARGSRPQPPLPAQAPIPASRTVAPATPALPIDVNVFWTQPRTRWLLHGLFASSVITLIVTFGSSYLALAMLSGFIGIPASVIHTIKSFEVKMDLAQRTRSTSVLSMAGLVLSLVAMLQLSWLLFLTNFECRTDPDDAPESVCITDYVWIGISLFLVLTQAVLFKNLLEKAGVANRLLNPVSSGLVSV